jgi:RNA polymerase sigma-70 factor (ECF subfamily)
MQTAILCADLLYDKFNVGKMTKKYAVFYAEHKDKLFSYLLRMSGDFELSRDIMQESFTRHFQHYGNDSPAAPAVLFTIARNVLIDYQRNQNRHVRSQAQAVEEISLQGTMDEERAYIVQEEIQRVIKAFNRLSADDREALSMAVGGLAYKHIAAVLGLSEANTKIKIHRARKKLREKLQGEQ